MIEGKFYFMMECILCLLSNLNKVVFRFYVMESMKDWYREGDPKKHVPKLLVGLFGGIAGAASVLGRSWLR